MAILNETTSNARRITKRRIIVPAAQRAQLRLTVDSPFTLYHFEQLFAVFKLRNSTALAGHIIAIFKNRSAQESLRAFYKSEWLDIPMHRIDTSLVILATPEIADELERIGGEGLGGVNKSKTFRVIVNYLAFVHKLKKPKRAA
jgi:hypothetical protein